MPFEKDIQHCLSVLHGGGIILYPTDTVWGLGCDATNVEAVNKIFDLKQRPSTNSLIVLVTGEKDVLKYVAEADLRTFNYLKHVKKPTTVIYEGAIGLAENLVSTDGSVGIRIVSDPFCKSLIKRFRKPIVSTSANLSGDPTPAIYRQVSPVIVKGVDYVVRYRQEDEKLAEPSTVIRWNREGEPTIIRP